MDTKDLQIVNLLPGPENVAQQLAAKMSRQQKDLLEIMTKALNPENGELQLIPKGKNKYRFPASSSGCAFNQLTPIEKAELLEFVKLSGWTHLYTTFGRWSFGD